jgi:hypothetical protein
LTFVKMLAILVSMMASSSLIRTGTRVYLKNAICGYPGFVASFDRQGRALVDWSEDIPEISRLTAHDLESLVVDEGFTVRQLGLDFELLAA